MKSSNLLVDLATSRDTLDSAVHREPATVPVSINRGRTQGSSIRVSLYRPSSARIQQISHIGASEYVGAPNGRDKIAGAPTIPVSVTPGGEA